MKSAPIRILAGLFAFELSLYCGIPVALSLPLEPTVLSDAQIQKLVILDGEKGHDGTFFSGVTRALGLTSVQMRQIVVVSHSPDVRHAFQLATRDGGYIFIWSTSADTRFYRTDERQVLVAAVSYKGADKLATIAPADAKKELAAEIGCWMQITNQL